MRILVIGAGDIGFELTKRLSREKHDLTIIEIDPMKVGRASEQLDAFVINGHGASYDVLKQANLALTEILAAMTDNDEVNLMACRIAKKAGVAMTIARVRNPEFTQANFILSPPELGVDYIIHPEKETASAVLRLIRRSSATYAVEFEGGRIDVLGVRLARNSPLLNTPLQELSQRYGNPPMRIVAIDRNHETLIPMGSDILIPGDQVFVVCDHDYSSNFIELAGRKEVRLRDVMILGGGLIGQFVAAELKKEANVKIIEDNEDKARKVAEQLAHTLVIHGDGTDFDLLANESLPEMDAFVAVTGDDETNIITTLLARHLQVSRAITLVNKIEYMPITPTIGVDTVVSKQLLTVNAVRRLIQQQQVASIASLPGIDAQLIEYIANRGCKIARKPLRDLQFPRNAIVGAVMQGENFIIPQGDTQIRPGDRVLVFTLPQAVKELHRLFRR